MPDYHHFSNHQHLSDAIIGFAQIARENGLNVGVQESLLATESATVGMLDQKNHFKYALKSIFCCSEDEHPVFEEIFDWYWGEERNALKSKTTYKNQSNIQKKGKSSVVLMGSGDHQEGKEEDSQNVSGANQIERLRKTDFTQLEGMDSQLLEELALKLWQQMSLRMKRKMKASHKRGQLDLRRTIRKSIGQGGEPFDLMKKQRKPRRKRLVMLLDVSGSMDKYSFFLLRFLVALRSHFEQIEAFIFSTSLVRITEYLDAKDLQGTLRRLSARADNWSSGTKIGDCLATFNDAHAKRILNGQSTVVVLSDGLDTGEPELLGQELQKIKLRTRQLIWLNPLKGMQNYEPIQRGMSMALPEVDVFRSAHNLNSILELEKYLIDVS
ncbi:MAG: VWA domain-containing protein [Bacteroidota bacterium]